MNVAQGILSFLKCDLTGACHSELDLLRIGGQKEILAPRLKQMRQKPYKGITSSDSDTFAGITATKASSSKNRKNESMNRSERYSTQFDKTGKLLPFLPLQREITQLPSSLWPL